MKFVPTALREVVRVDIEPIEDERGFFARTFCMKEFAQAGLPTMFPQRSMAHNQRRATLRGLHYQALPLEEGKLVRCVRGSLFDVAVDIRPSSATFGTWVGVELAEDTRSALYIPPGFAHGYQTLSDDCDVLYDITVEYEPSAARGIRWNDPDLSIPWTLAEPILSERDRAHPLWREVFACR